MMPRSESIRPPRPRGLLLTSALCIMVGWAGVLGAAREISFYRADAIEEPPRVRTMDSREQEALLEYFRAERRIRNQAGRVRIPLAVANLLLSGLLVFAASRTFAGRASGRSLALQALMANGLLAVVSYVLTREMRGELVPVIVQYMMSVVKNPGNVPEQELRSAFTSAVWSGFRVQLVALLALYGVSGWVLSTEAARAYFVEEDEPTEDDEEA
ncbi:MAG: hypothetical protein RMJ98_14490 [Myxococcales bacterium]|nr:hypothetical protein [Polyangiaceae bacterium]MDW8250500.1 hypothetical protein [Myxococcales bacterium]